MEQGDQILYRLIDKQTTKGGFVGSTGFGANYFSTEEISWANKFFIDAIHAKIDTYFREHEDDFECTVPVEDPRLEALEVILGNEDSSVKVLDAGCGTGRFSRELIQKFPSAEFFGVDFCDYLLKKAPDELTTRKGNLIDLPFPDQHFDVVFCIEALEHSLEPQKILAEFRRVLKENGKIIIIDKNSQFLGEMEITDFEQWFSPTSLQKEMQLFFNKVEVRPLTFPKYPKGLFQIWTGEKQQEILNDEQWHDAIIDLTPEQIAQKIRRNDFPVWVQPILKHTKPGDTVLEIGSGTGELSAILGLYQREVLLMDYSRENLDYAGSLLQLLNIPGKYYHQDMFHDWKVNEKVDWIFSSGVLEHYTDQQILAVLEQSYRTARKGVISLVPNAQSLIYRAGKYRMEQLGIWSYGHEEPRFSMKPYFASLKYKNIREYSIGPFHSLHFYPLEDKFLEQFYQSLTRQELQSLNQGYLLFTIAEV